MKYQGVPATSNRRNIPTGEVQNDCCNPSREYGDVASIALFALPVALSNLVDDGSNYEFVRHTLSRDTNVPGNAPMHHGAGPVAS